MLRLWTIEKPPPPPFPPDDETESATCYTIDPNSPWPRVGGNFQNGFTQFVYDNNCIFSIVGTNGCCCDFYASLSSCGSWFLYIVLLSMWVFAFSSGFFLELFSFRESNFRSIHQTGVLRLQGSQTFALICDPIFHPNI